jgi:serine/threonine-protein kinase PknG
MSATMCTHAGCGGSIGADGACEDCGRAPKGSSLLSQVSLENAGAAAGASTSSATSSFPSSRAGVSNYPSARAATMAFPSSDSGTVGSAKKRAVDTGRSMRAESRRLSSRSSRSTKGSSSRRRSLGGGLVSLPALPSQDPAKLVMPKAEVPLSKRRCPHCDHKVNRLSGFCPHCGKEYNFLPSLSAGDMVGGKYEVKGPIAFGGLGWIYLGWDATLSRWVVLKGLLNAKDEAAAAAAVTERRFLAAVKHPKIVGIHDFIQHGAESFIVMEFIAGSTIDSLRRAHDTVDAYPARDDPKTRKPVMLAQQRSAIDPSDARYEYETSKRGSLPIEEACAYILGILPAFGYLHEQGIVYCDFKPENFMVEGDEIKLIDMGGARRIGDPDGDIFGTRGFMAPEASEDPIAVSDLYSVGRALAVLTMDFKHQSDFEHSLPAPSSQPLLAQHESFQNFLLRATHPDPDERFQTATEMADQLHGVLREIVSLQGTAQPFESKTFGPDNLMFADDSAALAKPLPRSLPSLRIDPEDKRAAEAARIGAIARADARLEALIKAAGNPLGSSKFISSPEVCLRLAEAYAEKGSFGEAHAILDKLQADDPFDWKVQWERGKAHLGAGHAAAAASEFERVCFEMPGELAPKLARAFALETAGNPSGASALYELVGRVDPRIASACFGLARCRAALGDVPGAILALRRIPDGHSLRGVSRLRMAKTLAEAKQASLEMLCEAAAAVEEAFSEGGPARQLAGIILVKAAMLAKKPGSAGSAKILGSDPEEQSLRQAAEDHFRAAARMASSAEEKIHWTDMANRSRPHTLF